jgi:hypothetical protein
MAIAAAAVALVVMSPGSASAFGDRPDVPAGWVGDRAVRHWVYYPRYRNYYLTNAATDPFAYEYEPRGYYPYYNSGYWKPRAEVPRNRAHFIAPKYYQAWGANKKHWDQAKWHAEHHGDHRRSDW